MSFLMLVNGYDYFSVSLDGQRRGRGTRLERETTIGTSTRKLCVLLSARDTTHSKLFVFCVGTADQFVCCVRPISLCVL